MRRLDAMLGRVQNDLFDLGADLAVPQREGKAERLRVLPMQVERLEQDIDASTTRSRRSDIVRAAGRDAAAAYCIWRAPSAAAPNGWWWNCRAAERAGQRRRGALHQPVVGFPVCGRRHANDNGAGDVLWVPGQNR